MNTVGQDPRKRLGGIVLTLLLFVMGLFYAGRQEVLPDPVVTHDVVDYERARQLWSLGSVYLEYRVFNPIMLAAQGKLIFLGRLQLNESTHLNRLYPK
jgi:hypothetical protein